MKNSIILWDISPHIAPFLSEVTFPTSPKIKIEKVLDENAPLYTHTHTHAHNSDIKSNFPMFMKGYLLRLCISSAI